MKTLKFNYYDEFACTGPECEDTCCRDWTIYFTKREYLDLKKLECSPELRTLLNSAFKRTKSGNDKQYATVAVREDGFCPMLGKDGLCMLQKEKGESVMSTVCMVYPRNWRPVSRDAIAFTLSPTCCHVVELLMKHPEGLALVEGDYDGKNKWINRDVWTAAIFPPDAKTAPYIWTIKTAQLDILQNRNFTIAQRLMILGYYTQKACDYLKSAPEKLEQLSAIMLDNELCQKIADSLKTPQTDAEAAARSVEILYNMIDWLCSGEKGRTDQRTIKLLTTIADNLELSSETNGEGQNLVHWNTGIYAGNRELYRKIEEERSYIIENLFVSLAFAAFSKDENELWADYFSLAVLYNFLKMGTAAFLPENYTDASLAAAIAGTVNLVINANLAKGITMQDFAHNNTNSLPHLAFLIN